MKLRATVDMDENLKKEIQKIADERNWAFSYTSYVLLLAAVKEKNRKKKNYSDSDNNK